jgi:hypothetical protein
MPNPERENSHQKVAIELKTFDGRSFAVTCQLTGL